MKIECMCKIRVGEAKYEHLTVVFDEAQILRAIRDNIEKECAVKVIQVCAMALQFMVSTN